jgi:hypothetical protein
MAGRGRPFVVARRDEDTEEAVRTAYRAEQHAQRWVAWYRDGDLEEVRSHHAGGYGQTPRLSEVHQEQLATELETGRCVGWADEMRVGLMGTTRRVSGRRWVKGQQRLQLVREWRYLHLGVDPLQGRLWWF